MHIYLFFYKSFLSFLKHLFRVHAFLWDIYSKQARLERGVRQGTWYLHREGDQRWTNFNGAKLFARVSNFNIHYQFGNLARRRYRFGSDLPSRVVGAIRIEKKKKTKEKTSKLELKFPIKIFLSIFFFVLLHYTFS